MRNKDNPVGVSKQSAIEIILVMKYTLLLDAHYLFDASFLPGTHRHLLSSCALNRVHNGCKRVSKIMASRASSRLNGHPEINQGRATQVFPTVTQLLVFCLQRRIHAYIHTLTL